MEFDYTLKLDLPLDQAWETINDIERIAPCMPGAKIESRDGDNYHGKLKVKLGPMEMTYRGEIHYVERDDEAKRAVVDAAAKEIKGRGNAKTTVTMVANEVAGGSEVKIHSEFTVSGKAAQFGRGVMEEVGEKLMDDFATRLGKQLNEAPPADSSTVAPVAETAAPAQAPAAAAADTPDTSSTSEATTSAGTEPTDEPEALDLGNAVWGPLLKRLAIPAAVIALGAILYFML